MADFVFNVIMLSLSSSLPSSLSSSPIYSDVFLMSSEQHGDDYIYTQRHRHISEHLFGSSSKGPPHLTSVSAFICPLHFPLSPGLQFSILSHYGLWQPSSGQHTNASSADVFHLHNLLFFLGCSNRHHLCCTSLRNKGFSSCLLQKDGLPYDHTQAPHLCK